MKTSRLAALCLLAPFAVPAHALLLSDDFGVAAPSVSYSEASGIRSGAAVAIGGGVSRVLGTEILSNEDPGDARARSAVAGNRYSFSTDAEVYGDGRLGYSFAPSDLSAASMFRLDFLVNDTAGMGGVTLMDDMGRSASVAFVLPASSTAFSLVTGSFDRSGLDLTRIVRADFLLNPGQGGDLTMSGIQAVPEPASLAVFGIGGLGLLRRRRR